MSSWPQILWHQLGAAIDMLENAVHACPSALWGDRSRRPEFWHITFHTAFFLDYYLSDTTEGFAPPTPFGLEELDPEGVMPPRVYTKVEVLAYLEHCRGKAQHVLADWTETRAQSKRNFASVEGSLAELWLHNLRHVQHHAAQLNLLLRQAIDSAPRWVARAQQPLA